MRKFKISKGDEYILKKIMKLLKISIIVGIICGTIVVLLNNNKSIYPSLPKDYIAFRASDFIDVIDDNDGYLAIEYNGRKYIPYGTIKRSIKESDIDKCIGFIIQDEKVTSMPDENNKDTRIYSLTEDKDNNFLLEYYIGTNLMNQPHFWRAVDTKGKNILIPDCIYSLEYNYWK